MYLMSGRILLCLVSLLIAGASTAQPVPESPTPSQVIEEEENEEAVATEQVPDSALGDAEVQVVPSPEVETIIITAPPIGAEAVLGSSQSSVTAFDSEELVAMGVSDVADLAAFTPNLQIVTAGATSPTLFIRGVGLNDFSATSSGAIAVYEDGVAMNSPPLQLAKIFDLADAGTLRGPQGTGPYRNASGGVISLRSTKPSGEFGGYVRTSYGNYDFIGVEAAIETPLFRDVLSGRAAFAITRRDGYMTNRCADADPYDQRMTRPLGGAGTGNPSDPRWSQCGEDVARGEISDVPFGLSGAVNNANDWAARALLLFTPDWGFDSEWLLKGFGSMRDEDTRLGQSIGVTSHRSIPAPGEEVLPVGLGGKDGGGYRDADIVNRLAEIQQTLLDDCNCSLDLELLTLRNTILTQELQNLDSDPWAGAFNMPGPTTNDVWGVSLTGDNSITETLELSTITGFSHYDRTEVSDLDFSPNTLFHLISDDGGWQFTQEARLSGDVGDDRLRWEVGALYLHEELDFEILSDSGGTNLQEIPRRLYTQTTQSAIGYAELQWDLAPFATLDGGFRFNWERKYIDYFLQRTGVTRVVEDEVTWSAPTGRARLTMYPTEDVSFYLMYNRGWKAGNFNATGNPDRGVTRAEPETINAYEVGGSAAFMADRFSLTTAFFYYDYDDYQLFTTDNNLNSLPEFVLINASDVQIFGAEAQADLLPWEGALGQVRFGWLESRFLDFTQTQLTNSLVGLQTKEINNTGNPVPNSPRFDVSFTVEQAFDTDKFGVWTLRYDGSWQDDSYFDGSNGRGVPDIDGRFILPPLAIAQPAHTLHHLRASWKSADGRLGVAFWARNISNFAVKQFAFDATTFQKTTVYFVGEPRTYGFTVEFAF